MTSRRKLKKKKHEQRRIDRLKEIEDPADTIEAKCEQLASLIKQSRCILVYTGAGISTSAQIPDYRGPNGIWTLAEQGERAAVNASMYYIMLFSQSVVYFRCRDPLDCSPTICHMALRELFKCGHIRHILSQNCDGLHLRSGMPQRSLSEVHGNMHIEVCQGCTTLRQYIRPFDVTKKSQFRRHKTGRTCDHCHTELVDTIVHFGEMGRIEWPLNWVGTTQLLLDDSTTTPCDLIICLGTSLAVLKEYEFLWPSPTSDTKLVICNLQWTPKDRSAVLKINAKCDVVLQRIMQLMNLPIPEYCRYPFCFLQSVTVFFSICDPVLNTRRSSRNSELMTRITECSCHRGFRRGIGGLVDPLATMMVDNGGVPGWWAVGIARSFKRRPSTSTKRPERKRSRISIETSTDTSRSSNTTDIYNSEKVDETMIVVLELVNWLIENTS